MVEPTSSTWLLHNVHGIYPLDTINVCAKSPSDTDWDIFDWTKLLHQQTSSLRATLQETTQERIKET